MSPATNRVGADNADLPQIATDWVDKITPLLNSLDARLRDMRRQTNVGAYA